MFDQGDRVDTPGGPGTVVYKRMAAPDFVEVAVYSVKLDNSHYSPNGSTGTLYQAKQVKALCLHNNQYVSDRNLFVCEDCNEELGR